MMLSSPQESKKTYTIISRIDAGKVLIRDRSNRVRPISAGSEFSVGNDVLVVSGVLVNATSKPKIKVIDV